MRPPNKTTKPILMDDLNSFKERLEANLSVLNKFEGLETDLIQQHGNLRAQFGEYRDAIDRTSGINEQEKKDHFNHHDELIKRLHKLILVAKGLARKRTEQMTRDELFKLSQERQKSLKPQSTEDKIGEDVTKSLKRMLETMRSEVERSSSNISTATSTTKTLKSTTENYEKLSGTLDESRGLIRDLWKRNRNDMVYIFGALGIFVATVAYVILQRTPGAVWLPGKFAVRQVANLANLSKLSKLTSYLIPKSREIVEKITEMTEAAFSDTEEFVEPPRMFIDSIEKMEEEYGNDELLKESSDENIKDSESIMGVVDSEESLEVKEEVKADVNAVESENQSEELVIEAKEPEMTKGPDMSGMSDRFEIPDSEKTISESSTMVAPTETSEETAKSTESVNRKLSYADAVGYDHMDSHNAGRSEVFIVNDPKIVAKNILFTESLSNEPTFVKETMDVPVETELIKTEIVVTKPVESDVAEPLPVDTEPETTITELTAKTVVEMTTELITPPTDVTPIIENIQGIKDAEFISTPTEMAHDPESIVNTIEKTEAESEVIISPTPVAGIVEEASILATKIESDHESTSTPTATNQDTASTASYYSASATETESDSSKDYSSEAELFSESEEPRLEL